MYFRLSSAFLRLVLALTALLPAAFSLRAQQPTDLNALVAPIAEAISRSGKHRVLVLPLHGPNNKYAELGVSLARQISARLAATVSGFQEIVPASLEAPSDLGQQSHTPGAMDEIGRNNGAEIVVSGSFSFFESGLGVSLWVSEVGEKKFPTLRNGLLAFTADIPRPPEQLVSSGQGEPKIYRAGAGGVSLPRCIRCPNPNYPESERRKKRQGNVVLQILIGIDGRPSRIQVVRTASEEFSDAAVVSAKKFRFEPGKGPDGKPVPVLVNYEVTFRLF
jgi:TonB family protein